MRTGRWAFLWVVLLAGSCERSSSDYYGTTAPRHGTDIIWTNLAAEPEWIDPGKCSDSAGGTIIFNTFAGLTQPHPKTLKPMPDIAHGWEMFDGGRRYLFHLRKTQWSDGKPLTAHDFEYAFKRVLDRKTASKYASFLYPLRHAEQFNQQALLVKGLAYGATEAQVKKAVELAGGKVKSIKLAPDLEGAFVMLDGEDSGAASRKLLQTLTEVAGGKVAVSIADRDVVGVKALTDDRLEVLLEDPLPYFLDLMMFYTAMPIPRHVIERLEKEGQNPDLWTRPGNIVSNGAYTLSEWRFRQYMTLKKNPRFWQAAEVKTDTIKLTMVESANTTLNLYEAGELDYIGNSALPSEFMDHLKTFKDFRKGPFLASYFYWVNTKAPPLDDVRVRQALKLAINRQAIVEHVTRAGQIPSADLVPDGVGGYDGLRSKTFDPERAKALLAEAGYPGGKGFPDTALTYNTSEGHKLVAEAVQQMWKKHLGVRIEMVNQEWKVYLKTLEALDFQVARMGWIGDYADPYTFLELLMPHNGNNHSNWKDERFADLMREANGNPDPARRLSLMRQAEAVAMEATPMIPIYVYTRSEVMKPYLMGAWLNFQQRQLFKYWWIDGRWIDGVPTQPADNSPPPMPQPDPAPVIEAPAVIEAPPPADAGAPEQVAP